MLSLIVEEKNMYDKMKELLKNKKEEVDSAIKSFLELLSGLEEAKEILEQGYRFNVTATHSFGVDEDFNIFTRTFEFSGIDKVLIVSNGDYPLYAIEISRPKNYFYEIKIQHLIHQEKSKDAFGGEIPKTFLTENVRKAAGDILDLLAEGIEFHDHFSIVRENLIKEPNYSPYCGNEKCAGFMPRTKFNGEQFVCPTCRWTSRYPDEFIREYKQKWGK